MVPEIQPAAHNLGRICNPDQPRLHILNNTASMDKFLLRGKKNSEAIVDANLHRENIIQRIEDY